MTAPHPDIAALLGSRICHDLISPIGAISNGIELLQMSGSPMTPELELISESVENANARIRFFRIAFGAASSEQNISNNDIRSIIDDVNKASRARIHWLAVGDQPRSEAKLVFLLLQCFEGAMPWGGTITVNKESNTWVLQGSSDRMKLDQGLWNHLTGDGEAIDVGAADVQFLLLPNFLRAEGRDIRLDTTDNDFSVRF